MKQHRRATAACQIGTVNEAAQYFTKPPLWTVGQRLTWMRYNFTVSSSNCILFL